MSEKFEDGSWSDIPEPPVGQSLSNYAVIFDAGNFYYFGGFDSGKGLQKSILRLNADSWTWSNVGQLNSIRDGHGVTLIDNTFMVIGGMSSQPNEACFLNDGEFSCEQKSSSLLDYAFTPILFIVSDDYEIC